MLIAINYHYVRSSFDSPFTGIHGVTPEQRKHQLCLLGMSGEFVSTDEIREAIRGAGELPERLVMTFDDGLREQFDHALPLLDELGVPALFFTNKQPLVEGCVLPAHKTHLLRSRTAPDDVLKILQLEAQQQGIDFRLDGNDGVAVARYHSRAVFRATIFPAVGTHASMPRRCSNGFPSRPGIDDLPSGRRLIGCEFWV